MLLRSRGGIGDARIDVVGLAGGKDFGRNGGPFVFGDGMGTPPFGEVLPFRGHRADARYVPVGKDDDGVMRKELRDGDFLIAQIVVVGVFGGLGDGIEFDEDEGQA